MILNLIRIGCNYNRKGTKLENLMIVIPFTKRLKINSQSQIFRYHRSIFCQLHLPKFSDFFDLCLHWVSIVRGSNVEWISNDYK